MRISIQWAVAATVMLVIVSAALGYRWTLFNLRAELVALQSKQIVLMQSELLRDEMQFQMLYPGWTRGMVLHMNEKHGKTSFTWEW